MLELILVFGRTMWTGYLICFVWSSLDIPSVFWISGSHHRWVKLPWIDFILVAMPLCLEQQGSTKIIAFCVLLLSWWFLTRKNTWIFLVPQFQGGWKVWYMIKDGVVPRALKIQGSRIPLWLSALYHTIDTRCEMADSRRSPFAWAHGINSMDSFQVTFHHRPAPLLVYIFRRECRMFR